MSRKLNLTDKINLSLIVIGLGATVGFYTNSSASEKNLINQTVKETIKPTAIAMGVLSPFLGLYAYTLIKGKYKVYHTGIYENNNRETD